MRHPPKAGMAELADAADSKERGMLKLVRLRPVLFYYFQPHTVWKAKVLNLRRRFWSVWKFFHTVGE